MENHDVTASELGIRKIERNEVRHVSGEGEGRVESKCVGLYVTVLKLIEN